MLFWESIWDITTNICCFETFFLRHHNQHLLFWDILDITTNICCFETFWNITTNICKQLTSGLDGCSWVLPSRTWRNLYPTCWVWPMCGHLSLVTQGTICLERSWLELACWSPHHHRQLVAHHGMETHYDWTIQTWQNAGPVQTCTDPMLGHQTPLFHRMGTWRIYEPMIRGPVIYRLYSRRNMFSTCQHYLFHKHMARKVMLDHANYFLDFDMKSRFPGICMNPGSPDHIQSKPSIPAAWRNTVAGGIDSVGFLKFWFITTLLV